LNNIQYTAEFGNGVSGSIGLDDGLVYNRTALANLALGLSAVGAGINAYGGDVAPDIVGRIRVDQAWGLFQLSGALHEVNASYNVLGAGGIPVAGATALTDSQLSGHPDSKWGGSVMAALQIKNIPTGPGDDVKLDISYAKGDTKNVIASGATAPSFAMFKGNTVGFGYTSDGVYLPAAFGGTGDIKLTTAYGVRGAFNHNWDPYWSSALFGSYSAVKYGGSSNDLTTAQGQYCLEFAAGHPGMGVTYTCNPNYKVTELGVLTRWTPVKDLAFSAEFLWTHLVTAMTGSSTFTPAGPLPTATYSFANQNTFSGMVRALRNF